MSHRRLNWSRWLRSLSSTIGAAPRLCDLSRQCQRSCGALLDTNHLRIAGESNAFRIRLEYVGLRDPVLDERLVRAAKAHTNAALQCPESQAPVFLRVQRRHSDVQHVAVVSPHDDRVGVCGDDVSSELPMQGHSRGSDGERIALLNPVRMPSISR